MNRYGRDKWLCDVPFPDGNRHIAAVTTRLANPGIIASRPPAELQASAMPPRRKHTAFRAVEQHFDCITWCEDNRLAHEAKRPEVPWELARYADWLRICKRKDVEHPGPPDRFQALVAVDLAGRHVVLFVAYSKDHGALNIISMRVATSSEREIFFQHYP